MYKMLKMLLEENTFQYFIIYSIIYWAVLLFKLQCMPHRRWNYVSVPVFLYWRHREPRHCFKSSWWISETNDIGETSGWSISSNASTQQVQCLAISLLYVRFTLWFPVLSVEVQDDNRCTVFIFKLFISERECIYSWLLRLTVTMDTSSSVIIVCTPCYILCELSHSKT